MAVEVASIALRDIADVGNNPFSGWPVLGHNWTLGIKPKLKPGKGYGCFVAPDLPVGIPLTNGGTNCPPGFYCPFLIPNNSDTSPVLCPLNTYCTMVRLLGNRCMPQGMYEPMICWYGFYCPDPQTIIACPEGHHCISGVTAPKKCRMFSICPTGTIAEANYAYILLFLLIDFILFIYLMVLRSFDLVKQGLPALSVIPGFLTVMKYNRRQIRKRKHRSEHEQVVNIEALTNYVHEGAESQYCEKVTATEDSTNNEPQRLSDSTYNMDISNGLTATKTKPPLVHIDESQLDIDYPDASDSEEQQESLSLKSTAELARLELCSMVSNVSPLLEAFHSAFNGLENLRMNLKFNDLRYSIGDKVILDSVSGEIKAGRMTAILGPSGAGKTTFINVLMGKVARTSGDLMINGIQAEMHTFRKIIGYVPQDDIMLRELTVKEVVQYSARTRLPRDWSSKKVDDLVDAILKVLNLEHIAHTFIGDELDRGISGGQRKRVNIAMELASAPLALILDEPTSGLDSTSALKVAKILRSISRVGLTVVSIIHQPRIEIFNTFDDVLMIVPGGKTAYFGPVKKAVLYFESFLGFQFDKGSNPADVIMDILSGRGKMKEKGPTLKPETIAMIWKESGINFISQKDKQTLFSDVHAVQSMKMIVLSRGASFLQQCWLSYQRSLTQQARTARALFLEILVGMIAGLIMGIAGRCDEMYHGVVVAPFQQLSSTPNEWFLGLYGTLIGVAVAVAGGPAGVRLFGEEKLIYWRETASGHNPFAYYLGKNLSAIYRVALSSLHFTAIYVFFSKPSYAIELQYALVFLNFLCIYGVAINVSMTVRRDNASLMTVIIGLFLAIFDGFAPTLADARKMGMEFVFSLSPNRWASEAQFGLALEAYQGIYDLDLASNYFGYEMHQTVRNMLMMLSLAVGYRILGLVLMVYLNREKQR